MSTTAVAVQIPDIPKIVVLNENGQLVPASYRGGIYPATAGMADKPEDYSNIAYIMSVGLWSMEPMFKPTVDARPFSRDVYRDEKVLQLNGHIGGNYDSVHEKWESRAEDVRQEFAYALNARRQQVHNNILNQLSQLAASLGDDQLILVGELNGDSCKGSLEVRVLKK